MKKIVLCTMLLVFLLMAAGCSKKEIFITAEDITTDTMLVKRNGELQVAIVEDFEKPYYKLSELEEFVSKEINAYNEKAGGEEVKIDDLGLKDNKAVMVLKYTKMAHYSTFNNMPAAYFSADTDNVALELPDQYINAKNDSVVDKSTAFKNGKNKVLVLYEPYEIIVDGKVRYYSKNVTKTTDALGDTVLTSDGDTAVVIFTPY